MMTFGSLFAGIGGLDLGLERAGMRCAWQVEIDDYAQRVLRKHWPDVPRFGDVRGCGAHNLPYADLIAGGFPCQDISVAGKRAGIDGERSGLWSEFARIIGELRPRYALVENVPALLRRGMGRVLGDLAALGYDAEWDCLPAAAVGAPHIRDRVFIVAYPHGSRSRPQGKCGQADGQERVRSAGGASGSSGSSGAPALPIAHGVHAVDGRYGAGAHQQQVQGELSISEYWAAEPDVGRVAHGVPHRVDRLRGLGNAVVPQVAEMLGCYILELEARR